MKRSLIIAVLLLARSATCGEAPLHLAILGSNALDYGVMRAARADGLREWNPLLGQSLTQETAVKAGVTALECWGVHRLWRGGRKREAVIVTVGLVVINGVAAGVSLHRIQKR